VIQVIGLGGTSVLSSLSDSVGGDTVLADSSYTVVSGLGIGVYRVHNATAVSHTFTPNWATTPTVDYYVTVYEVSGISGVDTGAGTISINTGSSISPVTESLTPTANDDFLLAAITANNFETLGSWTNGFTQKTTYSGGPTFTTAYLVQSTAGAVSAGVGFSTGVAWAAKLVAYSAAGNTTPSVVGQAEASSATAQTSLATGTPFNVQAGDRFCAVVASESPTPPTVTDTAGDNFNLTGAVTPQSGYYLYAYLTSNGAANSAETVTAHGTSIFAVAALQLRGLVSSLTSYFPGAPGSIVQVTGGPALNYNPQVAPGTGTDEITSLTAALNVHPAMVIGFSAIPGKNGAAVNAAPNAGTGFTAQTGVWGTWGGGAGDYLGVFETEQLTSVTPVAATFTAPTYGTVAYGTFVWIIPASSVGP
jgi:hypothetical protein